LASKGDYKSADKMAELDNGKGWKFDLGGLIGGVLFTGWNFTILRGEALIGFALLLDILAYYALPEHATVFSWITTALVWTAIGILGFRWKWAQCGKILLKEWADSGRNYQETLKAVLKAGSSSARTGSMLKAVAAILPIMFVSAYLGGTTVSCSDKNVVKTAQNLTDQVLAKMISQPESSIKSRFAEITPLDDRTRTACECEATSVSHAGSAGLRSFSVEYSVTSMSYGKFYVKIRDINAS
jgi:hypothetical protein